MPRTKRLWCNEEQEEHRVYKGRCAKIDMTELVQPSQKKGVNTQKNDRAVLQELARLQEQWIRAAAHKKTEKKEKKEELIIKKESGNELSELVKEKEHSLESTLANAPNQKKKEEEFASYQSDKVKREYENPTSYERDQKHQKIESYHTNKTSAELYKNAEKAEARSSNTLKSSLEKIKTYAHG